MEDPAMLSQLSSGFPEAASEQARLMGMVSNGGLIFLMLSVGLLAFKPSWPLAAGVVSSAAVLGYMFRIASKHGSRA
jgi:hypothetical protein